MRTTTSLRIAQPELHSKISQKRKKPGVMAHPCHPSTQEAEAGRLLQVGGQPELHNETLSQTNKSHKRTQRKVTHRWHRVLRELQT